MEDKATDILSSYGLMAIASVRPDGWPQNTFVAYGNEGLLIYFLISRSSQKFANIKRDQRVALAIGCEEGELRNAKAVTMGAIASEVTDLHQRERGLKLILERHPGHREFGTPEFSKAALMRAQPHVVTLLDYSRGFGHADEFSFGVSNIPDMWPARDDNWGWSPAVEEASRE